VAERQHRNVEVALRAQGGPGELVWIADFDQVGLQRFDSLRGDAGLPWHAVAARARDRDAGHTDEIGGAAAVEGGRSDDGMAAAAALRKPLCLGGEIGAYASALPYVKHRDIDKAQFDFRQS
jgi:hypothetical protein